MSLYYSKFLLNTYAAEPYFQAHLPLHYPLNLVLQKSRAFRRLPPNLKELARLAKKWARLQNPNLAHEIDDWYDEDGYELNPFTRVRLTDEEIDAQWGGGPDPSLADFAIQDIPMPSHGFPMTWVEPKVQSTHLESRPSDNQLLKDIASHGREATAEEYGIPIEELPSSPVRSVTEKVRASGGYHHGDGMPT